jgi:hypothetical protein
MLYLVTDQTSGSFKYNSITYAQRDVSYVKVTLDDVVHQNISYDSFEFAGLKKDTIHNIKLQPIDLVGNEGNTLEHTWFVTENPIEILFDNTPLPRTNTNAFDIIVTSPASAIFKEIKWQLNGGSIHNILWDETVSGTVPTISNPPSSGTLNTVTASATLYFSPQASADEYTYSTEFSWYYDTVSPVAHIYPAPAGLYTSIASFTVTAAEPNCLYKHKLDKLDAGTNEFISNIIPWTGTYTDNPIINISGILAGRYRLQVRAMDQAGNQQPIDTFIQTYVFDFN